MKAIRYLLLALCAGMLPSCMTMDTLITVKPDGSGTIIEKQVLKGAAKEMLKGFGEGFGALAGEGADEDADPFDGMLADEKQAKARAEELGVEFVSLKKIEGKEPGSIATYKFKNIGDLKFAMEDDSGSEEQEFDGEEKDGAPEMEEKPITFTFTKGSPAKVSVHLPAAFMGDGNLGKELGGGAGDGNEEMGAAMMAMMAPMFKDLKIRLRMRFQNEIVKTDASMAKGNDIVLFYGDFGKLFADIEAIGKLTEMGDSATMEDFNKLPGMRAETKKKFDVTFK